MARWVKLKEPSVAKGERDQMLSSLVFQNVGKGRNSRMGSVTRSLTGKVPGLAALAAFLILAPHTARTSEACLGSACAHSFKRTRSSKPQGGQAVRAGTETTAGALFVSPMWRAVTLGRPHLGKGRALPIRRLRVGSSSLIHLRCLNRLLVDPWEVQEDGPGKIAVFLPAEDGRAKHVKKILKSEDGKTLRVGVVDAGTEEDAVVCWQVLTSNGRQKKSLHA